MNSTKEEENEELEEQKDENLDVEDVDDEEEEEREEEEEDIEVNVDMDEETPSSSIFSAFSNAAVAAKLVSTNNAPINNNNDEKTSTNTKPSIFSVTSLLAPDNNNAGTNGQGIQQQQSVKRCLFKREKDFLLHKI